jgi:enoyl-[acyl-carrier protein] reductase I
MGLMDNKKGVVLGVANKHSIAWGCCESLAREGARLFLSFQNERLQKKVEDLAAEIPGTKTAECDLASDESTAAFFDKVKAEFGEIDFLVHAVAFAKREDLEGTFYDTSRDGFLLAHDISAYTYVLAARHAKALMPNGGSLVTMTYLGSERVVKSYNVMGVAKAALEASTRYLAADLGPHGIRVNAVSAGPVNTLAARGIRGFTGILSNVAAAAPLRRNTDPAEVGDTTLFLCSDLARGVTGEVIYVDSGYHCLGLI